MYRRIISITLICIGALSVLAALGLIGYNMWDDQRAQKEVYNILAKMEEVRPPVKEDTPGSNTDSNNRPEEQPGQPNDPNVTPQNPGGTQDGTPGNQDPSQGSDPGSDSGSGMPSVQIDRFRYIGTVQIPSIGLELPIIDVWGYPQLKIAPCRYSGSVYHDNMVLCGHNYSSHFGRLKNLQPGDPVLFIDMEGNVYRYKVQKIENLQKTAVEQMTSGDWALTLFTCTPSGVARVAVRCTKEN